ncbi:MAG: metalloregulator ArsR/SmtB family transcription factor [Polyangiaceae bacterium]|nr:metalloregulator ArsR/SmtB family transcription factor [Polyangiaceae bacterium]
MPRPARNYQAAVYGHVARVARAVASPRRLELLELLAQRPRTVEALARLAELSVASASQHLQVLRAARLVEAERHGTFVEYRLAGTEVEEALVALRQLAERREREIGELTRDFLERRGVLEAIDSEELLQRVRAGAVTVLDVRPAEEYAAGHLPGAISVPLAELEARLRELPRRRPVVAYCRGPYCMMSAEAVATLRRRGFTAHRLDHGVVEWRARGERVETAPGAPPP